MEFDLHQHPIQLRIGRNQIAFLLTLLLFCLFVGLAAFFALNLKREIIPDESVHANISEYFSTTWGIPPDSPETYRYSSIQYKPFLYYWINGRIINLINLVLPDPGSWKTFAMLRLTNVFYASLAVVYCFLLAKELEIGRWWRLLLIFLLTHTLMFVFLSGGINYDNLVNLCCFAGIYHLIRTINKKPFYRNSLGWMIFILTGTLVKVTVLPLLAIMTLIWVIFIFRSRSEIKWTAVIDWQSIVLVIAFTVLVVLNFLLYGVNILKFRAVLPSCTMLLTEKQCEENPVFVRDRAVYLVDKLSMADMFNGNVPDPLVWFEQYWSRAMIKMTYGAIGHKSIDPSELAVTFYRLWIFWILIITIRYWKKPPAPVRVLAAIVLSYTLILLQTNLTSELNTGFKHLGIQGRYIFPVIGGIYTLIIFFIAGIQNKFVSIATVLTTLALFILNSPLWILSVPQSVQFPSSNLQPEIHDIRIDNDSEVSQDFTSECLGAITRVDVLFSAGSLVGAPTVNFKLIDPVSHAVITEQVLRDTPIGNETWLSFPTTSLRGTKDHPYRMILTTSSDDPNTYVSLWKTTTNVYRGGDATVKGVPTNNDLIFRYTCRMPLLADLFN